MKLSIDFYVVRPDSPRLSSHSRYLLSQELLLPLDSVNQIDPVKVVVGVCNTQIVSMTHFTHGPIPRIQYIIVNEDIKNPLTHVNLILKRLKSFIGFKPCAKEKNIWVKHFPDIGQWYFSQLTK